MGCWKEEGVDGSGRFELEGKQEVVMCWLLMAFVSAFPREVRGEAICEKQMGQKGITTVEALLCATRGCCGLVAKWFTYQSIFSLPYASPVVPCPGISSHHFIGNRWGNSVRLYFFGLQNHCRW